MMDMFMGQQKKKKRICPVRSWESMDHRNAMKEREDESKCTSIENPLGQVSIRVRPKRSYIWSRTHSSIGDVGVDDETGSFLVLGEPYETFMNVLFGPERRGRYVSSSVVVESNDQFFFFFTHRCPSYGDSVGSRPVCGTDGKDYPNLCELNRSSCHHNRSVEIKFQGVCGTSLDPRFLFWKILWMRKGLLIKED